MENWDTEAERERIARLSVEKQISTITAFDQGMEFRDEEDVRAYFDWDSLREMVDFDETIGVRDPYFPGRTIPLSAEVVEIWADLVVENQWHCEFEKTKQAAAASLVLAALKGGE
jgi:hypothetical protein